MYKFYFYTEDDAVYFKNRALEIAKDYEAINLTDLLELVGTQAEYQDNKVIWSKESIQHDIIYALDRNCRMWFVEFPEPDYYGGRSKESYYYWRQGMTPRTTVKPKETTTPEPFNITIIMDPSKDPYTTIREVIRQANEIKDRPVFITIN